MSCECCSTQCNAPLLRAWGVSATGFVLAPCGYLNPQDGLYYATVTTPCAAPPVGETVDGTCVCTASNRFDYSLPVTYSVNHSTPDIRTKQLDPNGQCKETVTSQADCSLTRNIPAAPCSPTNAYQVAIYHPDGSFSLVTPSNCDEPGQPSTEAVGWYTDGAKASYTHPVAQETPEAAFQRVLSSLPDFPDQPNGAAFATRHISSDGYGIAVAKAKYAFAIPPAASCYLKMTWIERFTPDDPTLAPTDTEMSYEWQPPSANGLCIPDGYDPFDPSTWSQSHTFELNPPSQNGSITVTEIKFTCIKGATPQPGGDA